MTEEQLDVSLLSLSLYDTVAVVHIVKAPLSCKMTFSTITSVQKCYCFHFMSILRGSVERLEVGKIQYFSVGSF